jgi:hypothetical protein
VNHLASAASCKAIGKASPGLPHVLFFYFLANMKETTAQPSMLLAKCSGIDGRKFGKLGNTIVATEIISPILFDGV